MKNFFASVLTATFFVAGFSNSASAVVTTFEHTVSYEVAQATYKYRCYSTGGVYVGTFGSPQEGFLCSLVMVSKEINEVEIAEVDNRSTFCYYDFRGNPVYAVYNPYLGKYICPAKGSFPQKSAEK